MRIHTWLLALALVLAVAVPSGAAVDLEALAASALATEAPAASGILQHVANIKHRMATSEEVGGRGR